MMTFSEWMRSIPNAYGSLKPDWVRMLREQVVDDGTYDQVTTWSQVKRLTNSHRSFLFWESDQSWERFLITLECLWNDFQRAKKAKQRRKAVVRNNRKYGFAASVDGAEFG
jgi:hypothetical protein